ncbi:dihydroxyacetone kinase subunit L [Streptomyces spiroverticillatus]|uniref:Dihydroxyacetone kinase subunit L n=1 Tax=Streptomyces finlayi TaxID=67296 RepID=A0A918XAC6_9ACTN|nr:dihydroxyacetone kinase subunit DhaL [Streptomyces finlayi]GHA48856.1 dihydroxyacetone kinase subunit L [Streptomyces spiroverticillatus]GHD19163.1 dihydroxyacetone kinase subunit L [Streptomyces finlayi]
MLDSAFFHRWTVAVAAAVDREADRLTELDSAIGDADHGSNLRRGFAAVVDAQGEDPPGSPGAVLGFAGRKLISTVGGASGPLYGTLLRRTGKALGETPEVSVAELAAALRAGTDAVAQLGGAAPGDKTMLDALIPAVEALETAAEKDDTKDDAAAAFRAARDAAESGALATVPLRARKGRASYLGERSVGHQDPGATSAALLFRTFAEIAEVAEATEAAG